MNHVIIRNVTNLAQPMNKFHVPSMGQQFQKHTQPIRTKENFIPLVYMLIPEQENELDRKIG